MRCPQDGITQWAQNGKVWVQVAKRVETNGLSLPQTFEQAIEFVQFMRFPRERQRILGDLNRPLFFNEDAAGATTV
jgi:hypothetical protein